MCEALLEMTASVAQEVTDGKGYDSWCRVAGGKEYPIQGTVIAHEGGLE